MTGHVIQIVRRFGPVGGMERYAWELIRHLPAEGWKVTVLCERLHADTAPNGVEVIELGEGREKPRWLAHLRFSGRVAHWLHENPQPEAIIHSHERTGVHHVTTFHGPPFARIRDKGWLWRFSLRILAQLWLEKREVCGAQVKAVVPNATLIAEMLEDYYPCIGERITTPITPGVDGIMPRPARTIPANGGIIGFVGKEWKRKGLDIAIRIFSELKQSRPQAKLVIAGANPQDIAPLLRDAPNGIEILGAVPTHDLFAQFDLLLHPAHAEPFGMVITEALSAGVPVVLSEQCGAASEVSELYGSILPLNASLETWSEACKRWLARTDDIPNYEHGWDAVAHAYHALYSALK